MPAGPIEDESRPTAEPVFDQAAVALIGVSAGRIEAFNAAAQRLFARNAIAVHGMELSKLFVSFHQERVQEALDRAARGIPSFPSLLAKRYGGAPTEVDVRVGPLTVGGQIVGATLVVLDVRAQNRSIRELQAERDAALAGEERAQLRLRELQQVAGPNLGAVSMIPGTLIEAAVPVHANIVTDLSEGLYESFVGRADAIRQLVSELLARSKRGGPVIVRGQVQARRCEWALIRLEIVEDESVHRSSEDWARLRRLATELEGAIGHETCALRQRRIWLTLNLVGQDSSTRRPSHRLAGARVALDVRYEAERAAIAHRLRSWHVRVVEYTDGQPADLIVSDRLPSSEHVVRLGDDIPRPVRRDVLHETISTRLAARPLVRRPDEENVSLQRQ